MPYHLVSVNKKKDKGVTTMKRKFTCLIFTVILCLSFTSMAFANTQEPNTDKSVTAENQIEPQTDGYYVWELTKKSSPIESYGPFSEACREYTDGSSTSTLKADISTTVSHTYSGTLQVPIEKLSSYVGLSITIGETWAETAGTTLPLSGKEKGTWAILWRKEYDTYKVTQTKYHVMDGLKTKVDEETVVVRKYKSISFDSRKISSDKKTRVDNHE